MKIQVGATCIVAPHFSKPVLSLKQRVRPRACGDCLLSVLKPLRYLKTYCRAGLNVGATAD